MKKIISRVYVVLCIIVATMLSSCVKDDNGGTKADVENFTQLKVPASFSWSATQNVEFAISSATTTRVFIELPDTDSAFAAFWVGGDEENVNLSLPSGVKKIKLIYVDNDYSEPVELPIVNGKVTYTITMSQATPTRSDMVTPDAKPNQSTTIFYPATVAGEQGWGTLFFEDMFPSYGDYDFNDMVFNYRIMLSAQNKNMINKMRVTVRVNAIGGSLPNDLYLSLTGVTSSQIGLKPNDSGSAITLVEQKNAPQAVLEMITPTVESSKDVAVFHFANIKNRPEGYPNAAYINTEYGYVVPKDKLVEVTFDVEFRNAIKKKNLTLDKFDFFIASTGTQAIASEIHLADYAPIFITKSTYDNITINSSTMKSSLRYYCSDKNLVWALNIPAYVPHVYEKENFLNAYPRFAGWVESGGTLNTDWYATGEGNRVSKYLIDVEQ